MGDFCLIKPASAWPNLTKSIPRLPRPRSAAAAGGRAAGRAAAGGSDQKRPGKNRHFIAKRRFRLFLTISGPSRPQKWIQFEISVILVVSRGLYDENKYIS